jgi:phosphoribosyl isomerase A
VDLDAAFTGEPRNRHLIERIVAATGCDVQASGGIRTLDDIRAALGFGAQRVVVGTMALTDPASSRSPRGRGRAAGGRARREGRGAAGARLDRGRGDLFEVLGRLDALGVARFIFTDIETDGMLSGPNLTMLTRVADATSAAVTASGGVASVAT